jgi:hypothetical protein
MWGRGPAQRKNNYKKKILEEGRLLFTIVLFGSNPTSPRQLLGTFLTVPLTLSSSICVAGIHSLSKLNRAEGRAKLDDSIKPLAYSNTISFTIYCNLLCMNTKFILSPLVPMQLYAKQTKIKEHSKG